MKNDEPYFEIASGRELREKYGLTAANRPTIRLNPANVPEQFRQWIPLAERWGIGDDLIRDDCIRIASPTDLEELLAFGDAYDAVLTEWLAGAESHNSNPSEEYVAFTCLGMAYDEAKVITSKRAHEH